MAVSKARREPASEGTLISDIQPPELRYDTFLPLQPPVEGTLFWQPQQMSTPPWERGVVTSLLRPVVPPDSIPGTLGRFLNLLHLQNGTSDGFVARIR